MVRAHVQGTQHRPKVRGDASSAKFQNGKTVSGRALGQEELTSLREQEVVLVKKQKSRRVVSNAAQGKRGKTTSGRALRQEELTSLPARTGGRAREEARARGEELKEASGLTLTATVVVPSGDGLLACLHVP